eukprot:4813256-Prymnesium_polylepis.1
MTHYFNASSVPQHPRLPPIASHRSPCAMKSHTSAPHSPAHAHAHVTSLTADERHRSTYVPFAGTAERHTTA